MASVDSYVTLRWVSVFGVGLLRKLFWAMLFWPFRAEPSATINISCISQFHCIDRVHKTYIYTYIYIYISRGQHGLRACRCRTTNPQNPFFPSIRERFPSPYLEGFPPLTPPTALARPFVSGKVSPPGSGSWASPGAILGQAIVAF